MKHYNLRHNLAVWGTGQSAETTKEAALKFIKDPLYNHTGNSYIIEVTLSETISVLHKIQKMNNEYVIVDTDILDQ